MVGAGAWPGDAAEPLTSGETSAEQTTQLHGLPTPLPTGFSAVAVERPIAPNAPILFLLVSLGR